jgi:osmoprotectant transport system ATP-binding protein
MIEFKNVFKSYRDRKNIIENLSFKVSDGEFLVLVGESGCGKTTTLQMINRLVDPTSGDIELDGKKIRNVDVLELRRNIGYVIQNTGLFPHWTIEENISTLLKLKKIEKKIIDSKVKEYMSMVNLDYEKFSKKYPNQLSGGERQRVGVARALINDPKVILMDEPFSALDPITRKQLQDELLRIHAQVNKTIIFVTHDIDEAIKLGDRIAVMQDGKIAQLAQPEEILKNPINAFVEKFVGPSRLWKTPDMLSAKDVMMKNFTVINPDRNIAQAVEIMKDNNTPIMCVVDKVNGENYKLLGIVGQNRMYGNGDTAKMIDIMKTNVTVFNMDSKLIDIMQERQKRNLEYNPVVDNDGYLVGMITNTSILNVFAKIIPNKEDY